MQVRTRDEPEEEEEEDEGQIEDDSEETAIHIDQSLIDAVDQENRGYKDCAAFAKELAFVYRQEILEILNLYGLSHESDLWCRNSSAGASGELEDTAYTELEKLVTARDTVSFYTKCFTAILVDVTKIHYLRIYATHVENDNDLLPLLVTSVVMAVNMRQKKHQY